MAKAIFSGVMESKCICTGKNCRMSPFIFSLAPRSQEAYRCAKTKSRFKFPAIFSSLVNHLGLEFHREYTTFNSSFLMTSSAVMPLACFYDFSYVKSSTESLQDHSLFVGINVQTDALTCKYVCHADV